MKMRGRLMIMSVVGRKRVNKDKDAHPAKRTKVEGETAVDGTEEEEVNNNLERLRGLLADDPKKLSKKDMEEIINHLNADEIMSLALEASQGKRSDDDGDKVNVCVKVEGEIAVDGTDEEEVNNKLERLRGLLADDPKKLSKKDMEEIINHLNADEIMSLALEASQGKRSGDDGDKDNEDWDEKALNTVRVMLCSIEHANRADIRELYEKWPTKAFAMVLLSALDSYADRNLTDRMRMVKYYDIIPKLCSVLPWKLFAYVLYEKRVIGLEYEDDEEEISRLQKEAAEMCGFCNGEGTHTGTYGTFCSMMEDIPKGTAVVPGYWIECSNCQFCDCSDIFKGCLVCGCEVGNAVHIRPP